MLRGLAAKLKSDFILVLGANLFSYLIAFCGSVIYVRLLGKTDFGLYTFAFNIISLFLLVNGFGAASGVLQYVSKAKNQQEQLAYLKFAFRGGLLFNLIISILILGYAECWPLPIPAAKPLLLAMAFFPLGRLYIDIFQAYLRARQQNILQAKFSMVNSSILLLSSIVGILYAQLYGLVYFTYVGYVLMLIVSTKFFALPAFWQREDFSSVQRRQFISYSFFTTSANAFSGLLFVLDIIIISYVIKDPKLVAVYRVATIIPFAINFIPNLAVNFYYPEFAKNAHDPARIRHLARWLALRMFIFSGLVSLFLVVAAAPLIKLIFGPNYQDSVLPFQILSFGYWIIATFRTINGNILAALGKAKTSFYLTFIILLLNIAITYLMVVHFSIRGAALAVIIMYVLSSVVGYVTLKVVLNGLENPE